MKKAKFFEKSNRGRMKLWYVKNCRIYLTNLNRDILLTFCQYKKKLLNLYPQIAFVLLFYSNNNLLIKILTVDPRTTMCFSAWRLYNFLFSTAFSLILYVHFLFLIKGKWSWKCLLINVQTYTYRVCIDRTWI